MPPIRTSLTRSSGLSATQGTVLVIVVIVVAVVIVVVLVVRRGDKNCPEKDCMTEEKALKIRDDIRRMAEESEAKCVAGGGALAKSGGRPVVNVFTDPRAAASRANINHKVVSIDRVTTAEMIPTAEPPLAQFVQLVDPVSKSRLVDSLVYIRVKASAHLANDGTSLKSLQPAYIDLGSVVPITEIELFNTGREGWVPAVLMQLLGSDAKTVVYEETVPRFYDVTRIVLHAAAAYRPLVWDGKRANLAASDPVSGTLRNVWYPDGAAHETVWAESTRGLVHKKESGAVHVERLKLVMPAVELTQRSVFLAAWLPAVTEPTILVSVQGPNGVYIALGYGSDGRLLYYQKVPDKSGTMVEGWSAPIGDPITVNKIVTLGVQFSRSDPTGSLLCTLMHPSGTVYRVEAAHDVPPPQIGQMMLWDNGGDDSTCDAGTRRLLPIHELLAFTTTLTDRQMLALHSGMTARWV